MSRATVSIAHRSYCEGDRLQAEGEKFKAEARAIMEGGRASRAKEINTEPSADKFLDPDWEDPALRALRERP